jgi:arsenate reductase
MAHGILQSFSREIAVFSAGTRPAAAVNPNAIAAMEDLGVDISHHVPHSIEDYLGEEWDYVVTVCGNAKEDCPIFMGNVKHRLHIGFADPVDATGSPEEISSAYTTVRDEILRDFYRFYNKNLR